MKSANWYPNLPGCNHDNDRFENFICVPAGLNVPNRHYANS